MVGVFIRDSGVVIVSPSCFVVVFVAFSSVGGQWMVDQVNGLFAHTLGSTNSFRMQDDDPPKR